APLAGTAHAHPDRGAVLARAQLDQVAHLVDQPQAMATVLGALPDPPGQRVGDPPAVVDLAEDLLAGVPDVDHPAGVGVADRVRGDLVRGQDQVDRALLAEPGQARVPLDQSPYRRQVRLVGKSLRLRGRRAGRAVAFRG